MGEPIVIVTPRHLRLLTPIRFHPPDLHPAGAFGVEVNPPAIGAIIRTVVQSRSTRQPCLFSTVNRDEIDVEIAVPFRAVGERFPVRRPSVPIRRSRGGDLGWG